MAARAPWWGALLYHGFVAGETGARWRETASGFGLNQWQSVEKLRSFAAVAGCESEDLIHGSVEAFELLASRSGRRIPWLQRSHF